METGFFNPGLVVFRDLNAVQDHAAILTILNAQGYHAYDSTQTVSEITVDITEGNDRQVVVRIYGREDPECMNTIILSFIHQEGQVQTEEELEDNRWDTVQDLLDYMTSVHDYIGYIRFCTGTVQAPAARSAAANRFAADHAAE